eukprot:1545617-Lingulodinium_polyedra.AAC.1
MRCCAAARKLCLDVLRLASNHLSAAIGDSGLPAAHLTPHHQQCTAAMSDSDDDLAADASSQVGGPTPKKAKQESEDAASTGTASGKAADGKRAKPGKAASPLEAPFTCTLCRKTHETWDKVPGFQWGR